MAKCGACGKAGIRKTSMALVIERGKAKGKRVCGECAATGILIVNSTVAPVVETTKAERRDQKEVLAPFIRLFESQAKAMKLAPVAKMTPKELESNDGRIEQLENVIAALKEGRA